MTATLSSSAVSVSGAASPTPSNRSMTPAVTVTRPQAVECMSAAWELSAAHRNGSTITADVPILPDYLYSFSLLFPLTEEKDDGNGPNLAIFLLISIV